MKNKFVPYQNKEFKKKSNSLKVFNKDHKRSSKTIKHILSDKVINFNESQKKNNTNNKSTKILKKPKSKNLKKNEKENESVQKSKIEISKSKPNLDTFITKVKEEKSSPTDKFLSSVNSSNKLITNPKSVSKIPAYYMEGLHKAFIKRSSDYFSNLSRVHFNQSLQFINVKKSLNLSNYTTNGKLSYIPGSNI